MTSASLRALDVLSLDKRKRIAEAEALRQDLDAYDQLLMEAQARFALSLDAPAGPDADELTLREIHPGLTPRICSCGRVGGTWRPHVQDSHPVGDRVLYSSA